MNIDEVERAVKRVLEEHPEALSAVASSQSKLLELAAVTGVAEHFKHLGFQVKVAGKTPAGAFLVKTSTRGYPWNFSRFDVELGETKLEIHMNLMVRGAHDEGVYCVDVGLVRGGVIPAKKAKDKWICAPNAELITFLEAKKLVIYPMLLAQFIGIVHEIMPSFLKRKKKGPAENPLLPPTLVVLGHYSGNSTKIVSAYQKRGINVMIAENYDYRLMRARTEGISPFYAIDAEEHDPSLAQS
jgi:hypothetical protein